MKKRILSILLCFCMTMSLLPMSALAAGPSVKMGDVSLTSSKYYTVSGTTVTQLDSVPTNGGYLYYTMDGTNATLAVTGDVTFTKAAGEVNPILLITGCTLNLTGSGNLTLSATRGSAVYGDDGSLVTNDYTGDLSFTSLQSYAIYHPDVLTLETTGALTITGGAIGNAAIGQCSSDIKLKGGTVDLSGGYQLISTSNGNISITADTGDLAMSGSDSNPLFQAGSSGTGNVTLSAPNGAVSVNNTASGIAVNGNLSADAGGNVTVESTGHHAVAGALTVTKAKEVTVTSAGSSPTIGGATDITADGNVSIQNTSSGMAVGNTLTATSTNGSVTVEGKHTFAPTIAGITTITAAKDIRITSASPLDIGATEGNTLTAGGFVIRSKSTGTTITKDGAPITAAYGGDVSTSGLNLSGKNNEGNTDPTYNAPAAVTLYKAGDGYALFTPATTSPAANAKLEMHGAEINTTSGRALYLPAEPVDITVTGDNTLTANGSYNYAIDPNGQAVSMTGDGNLSLNGNKGIASWDGGMPGVIVDIGGDLEINTTRTYSITSNGDINLSAASITTGIITAGSGSFTATAKTGNLTIDNGESSSLAVGACNITMDAPNGAISVTGKGNILLESSGMVTLNAKGNIAFTSSNTSSVAIFFGTGVAITSNAGSIDVTTSGYSCIEKTSSGAGGGAVTLSAAKDITLNAENTAISASGQAVNITAGGKLSSTSFYGFQVGALTIKANEVSIEGTQQDGIQASSVSITNPTGGNCKHVSITATSSDATCAAIRALGSATTGNITVKADDLFLCGNGSAKAISALGTVTIDGTGIIVGAISAGNDKISAGIARANKSGGKISDKLDLKTNTPTETTYYEIDNGIYIIFAPKSANENAVLTLHNVYNAGYLQGGVILPDEPVTLKLEGVNVFFEITASNNIVVSGNGLLDSEINNSNADATVTVGDGATLNAMYRVTAVGVDNITVYGNYFCDCVVGDTTKLKLNAGAVMKLEYGRYLEFKEGASLDKLTIGDGASIVNDTHVTLPKDTTVEQIKALPLSGTGVVRVTTAYDNHGYPETWNTYTNEGVAVKEITGGLDLSTDSHNTKTVEKDGYSWDSANHTLTLGNHAYVSGDLKLPCNTAVIINTTESSSISGTIVAAADSNGYHYPIDLTFTGTAPLTINGGISGKTNNDTVTVQNGAQVTVIGSVFLGGSGGQDGTLNVTGAGTALNIQSDRAYGVSCDTVNVQNGAHLTAKANGTGTMGVEALDGGVHITGGSTLQTGCDYGVYIIGGKLEVDSTSKLVTNGAVAPFCIVDTASSKVQDNVLSLPGTPKGTAIKSVTGTTDFSGKKHTYWSLTDGGNLNVVSASENNTPVTLTGAKTGLLTFEKVSSGGDNNNGGNNSGGGGSGGGSSSVSYTLNFETNGGSKISSISKENGTTLDLASYKPTRDGYDFAGWYANQALTDKVTSVKLTKNTTVYAKWTEKSAKPVNPFADVAEHAYYHDAVLWAVQKNVTSGTTSTAFSPDMICTRAQMVTFLWRAMGSPEPSSANCPFTDVSKDAYYHRAVLWAVEKGITAGVTETSFSPDATVSRGQSVTFLWRAAGKPEVSSANPYTDVSKDAFYYNAMLWAVEKGITKGTSATSFSPDGGCTRSQIVTFLYRYMGK